MTPMDRYRGFVMAKGLRVSREREIVAEEVFSSVAPFDAEQLLARLATREQRVSRSTMYRTLDSLLDAGLIRLTTEPDGRQSYHYLR